MKILYHFIIAAIKLTRKILARIVCSVNFLPKVAIGTAVFSGNHKMDSSTRHFAKEINFWDENIFPDLVGHSYFL